jgi:hypothetical protein
MNGATFAYLALAVVAGLWLWVAAAFQVVYRPRRPKEGPATSELLDHPPAIVNMITHEWVVTPSAPAATLLDLACRGVIEIVQVSPEQDVVELRRGAREVGDLRSYERQVLDHLRRRAIDGVVPATALTTGPASASDAWWSRFRRSVERDARRRGLAQRRFPPPVVSGMAIGLGVLLLWLLLAFSTTKDAAVNEGPRLWSVILALAAVGAAVLVAARFDRTRQRDTDEGLAAATHWLGVRRGYADVDQYEQLPPAAVVLYERHLAYAAAMDVARRAIARLPLSAEDDRRAWSRHGGRWRQVKVRYPRRRIAWGEGPGRAIIMGTLWTATLLIPIVVLRTVGSDMRSRLEDFARSVGQVSDPGNRLYDANTAERLALGVTLLIVAVLAVITLNAILRGGVRLARGLLDAGRERTVRGTVVRRRTWPHQRGTEQVELDWVAVDDGTENELRAFIVRRALAAGIHQDEIVELTVTPFLGFVRMAKVLAPAPALPPPRPIDQLAGPKLLPPVHWSDLLGPPTKGAADNRAADNGAQLPGGTPVLAGLLARPLQRLLMAKSVRR